MPVPSILEFSAPRRLNGDAEGAAAVVDPPGHPNLAARPVVLDRVAEQVHQHLAQPHPVGADVDLFACHPAPGKQVADDAADPGAHADAGRQRQHHRERVQCHQPRNAGQVEQRAWIPSPFAGMMDEFTFYINGGR